MLVRFLIKVSLHNIQTDTEHIHCYGCNTFCYLDNAETDFHLNRGDQNKSNKNKKEWKTIKTFGVSACAPILH